MIPSRYHRTLIRWLHDNIARASRSRLPSLDNRAASCFRESKIPDTTDVIRSNNDDVTIVTMTRCHYDGLTMCKIDTRSQNENELSRELRSIFLHAKDFAFAHEVAAEAWKIQPAVTRWVKMASRMARCFQDQTQI